MILDGSASGKKTTTTQKQFAHTSMLVIYTGAEAKDDELLFGELGPIAQATRNRLKAEGA